MTPLLKTGTRRYQIHYSLMVNGENHEKIIFSEGQNEAFVNKKLRRSVTDPECEIIIHSTIRVK